MRVTEKGQVTIPKIIRDRLGIVPGSEVEFIERDKDVVLEKRKDMPSADYSSFKEWAAGVAGLFDNQGMDGKQYVDWLRGPRDDVDSR